MKTAVKIRKDIAEFATELFNAGKTPWVIVKNGVVYNVYAGRAAARADRENVPSVDAGVNHVVIVKAEEVKFEVFGDMMDGIDTGIMTNPDEEPEMEANAAAMEETMGPVERNFQAAHEPSVPLAELNVPENVASWDVAQKQGDAAANAALVDAPTTEKGKKIEITRHSTVEKPCKRVWHIACEMAEAAGGHDKIRRKDVLARCVAEGIAFYTARTQYQLWLTIQNGGTI